MLLHAWSQPYTTKQVCHIQDIMNTCIGFSIAFGLGYWTIRIKFSWRDSTMPTTQASAAGELNLSRNEL